MFLKTTAQSSAEKKSGQTRDTTSRASISVGGGGTGDGGGTGGGAGGTGGGAGGTGCG